MGRINASPQEQTLPFWKAGVGIVTVGECCRSGSTFDSGEWDLESGCGMNVLVEAETRLQVTPTMSQSRSRQFPEAPTMHPLKNGTVRAQANK